MNRLPFRPRLGEPAMSEPVNKDTQIQPVSPTGQAVFKMPLWLTVALSAAAAVSGVVAMIPGMPPIVVGIASGVTAICAALGIISPGARKS